MFQTLKPLYAGLCVREESSASQGVGGKQFFYFWDAECSRFGLVLSTLFRAGAREFYKCCCPAGFRSNGT